MAIETVIDLLDLRRLAVGGIPDGALIHASHHSLSIDQGGGLFRWDPSFVGTTDDSEQSQGTRLTKFDDNGTFIKPDAIRGPEPGRWRRVDALENPAVMRAKWFGAVSYPSQTISSKHAIDSHPAIQAALDALPIVTFNCPRTRSGRFIRVGMVELSTGDTFIGNTLRVTCRCTIRGQGKGFTYLFTKHGAFPLAGGEKWMIEFEKPDEVNANNCFNTCCEDLTIYALCADDNEGVSGLSIFGAQGSHVKDVDIHQTGIRGILCDGISMIGECWIANCLRGPLVDFRGMGGPGARFGNLSIEHCNQAAKHIDPDNGLPYAALKLKDTLACHFDQLQFEASPVNISIVNGRGIAIDSLLANVALPGIETHGVHVSGDSYGLSIPPWYNLGGVPHTHPYVDDSLIARALKRSGEVPPVLTAVAAPFEVTATATQGGAPVKATVIRKPQSLGWFISSAAALNADSSCTIEIAGSPRDWSGVYLGGAGFYGAETGEPGVLMHPFERPAGVLARVIVARTTADQSSGRISKALITGSGTRLNVLPEADLAHGTAPPPEIRFTVSNPADGSPTGISKVIVTAVNSDTSPASFSLNVEIL